MVVATTTSELQVIAAAAAVDEPEAGVRALALLAILALLLAGVLIVACVLVVGRWIRRRVDDERSRRGTRRTSSTAATASPGPRHTDHGRSDETFHGGADAETRHGT